MNEQFQKKNNERIDDEVKEKTLAEIRAVNITKKIRENFKSEEEFSEANSIALKINTLIDSLPMELQKNASDRLLQLLKNATFKNNIYYYKELHDELYRESKEEKNKNEFVKNIKGIPFSEINSFDDLIFKIDSIGGVQGSNTFFSSDMLKEIIAGVRSGKRQITEITSTDGLRKKVANLIEIEIAQPNPNNVVNRQTLYLNGELKDVQTQYLNDPDKIRVNYGRGWNIMDKSEFKKIYDNSDKIIKIQQEVALNKNIELVEASLLPVDSKLELTLMLLGRKKGAQLGDYKVIDSVEERKIFSEKFARELSDTFKLLESTNLEHQVVKELSEKNGIIGYSVLTSKDEDILRKFVKADKENDNKTFGRIVGYPETAVETYGTNKAFNFMKELPTAEIEKLKNEGVLPFLLFMPSKEHWAEELEWARENQQLIKQKAPKLYQELIQD